MIKLTKKYYLLLAATCMLIAGCAGNANVDNSKASNVDSSAEQNLDPSKSTIVKVNNRLFNVPSPLQLAEVFKKLNLPFNKELLNNVSFRQNYTTSFKQSLNVGIYGADLGYINVYEQLPEAASYFAAIRSLSSELGILNSFNESTMKRIERNNGDKDSLMYIASIIYRESDSYLMNSDRNEVSALIIAGGWVEGLYLMTHVVSVDEMTPELMEFVGLQKRPLDNLIELLRPYFGKLTTDYDTFLESLSDIASVFDEIEVKYTYKPSQTDEAKKLTIINSESQAILDKTQVKTIADKVERLRQEITK